MTVSVSHNGPVDLTISCSGDAEGRLTKYTKSDIIAPKRPPLYYGDRQYEAEHFEYKNVSKVVTNGWRTGVDKFTGQGYMIFGRSRRKGYHKRSRSGRIHIEPEICNKRLKCK